MLERDLFSQLDRVGQLLDILPRGLVVDVDGTISEIAPSPDSALVDDTFKRMLRDLRTTFDLVAVISGRSVHDVKALVGVDGLVYVGNHGAEWWSDGQAQLSAGVKPYIGKIAAAVDEIRCQLSASGVTVENKRVTAAIHYREAAEPELARQAILTAIANSASAQGLRITVGKMVVELRPPVHINKGQALARLVRKHGLKSVIYLGDDSTDVDAFVLLRRLRTAAKIDGLAIAVLSPETLEKVVDNADATLQGVSEVGRFLRWLEQATRQATFG